MRMALWESWHVKSQIVFLSMIVAKLKVATHVSLPDFVDPPSED